MPVFSPPIEVEVPDLAKMEDHLLQDHAVAGYIFQATNGDVFGIWVRHQEIVVARFDPKALRFEVESRIKLAGLPRLPRADTASLDEDGQMTLFLSVSNDTSISQPWCITAMLPTVHLTGLVSGWAVFLVMPFTGWNFPFQTSHRVRTP